MPTWTLQEALALVRDIQPIMREMGYHITLGGGVLNTGGSTHDLDLWFIPLNGYPSTPREVMGWLLTNLSPSRSLRDGPDYGPDFFLHAVEMQEFNYLGKRVDVFIQ